MPFGGGDSPCLPQFPPLMRESFHRYNDHVESLETLCFCFLYNHCFKAHSVTIQYSIRNSVYQYYLIIIFKMVFPRLILGKIDRTRSYVNIIHYYCELSNCVLAKIVITKSFIITCRLMLYLLRRFKDKIEHRSFSIGIECGVFFSFLFANKQRSISTKTCET